MAEFEKNKRNRVARVAKRASYDRDTIYQIIDEALICHVGFAQDGQPFVIPTIHARDGDKLIFHGAPASRLQKHAGAGVELSVSITLLDGLVLARSVFHHSMNYRSVVLFGRGYLVDEEAEKLHCLQVLTERIMPGRWEDARQPNPKEMQATSVVVMKIEDASAKIRSGPPGDDEEDYQLSVWAGVLPVQEVIHQPVADPSLSPGIELPDYIRRYLER